MWQLIKKIGLLHESEDLIKADAADYFTQKISDARGYFNAQTFSDYVIQIDNFRGMAISPNFQATLEDYFICSSDADPLDHNWADHC